MRRNRCNDGSGGKSTRRKVMNPLLLGMVLLLVHFHNFSHNHYGDAFVLRQRQNIVSRQHQDQKTKPRVFNRRNACEFRRETIKEIESFNFSPFYTTQSSNTIMFDSMVTDQELEQETSTNSPQPGQTTDLATQTTKSSSSTSIEVLMKHDDSTSATSSPSREETGMSTANKAKLLGKMKKKNDIQKDDADVPKPTANGGYSHTKLSRAKISAANKGKTPWNKGKPRSPEVKARIAAGVRARNRKVFLQKLEDLGMTEEEYEAKKKEERRAKEAERRARRTANGGYRPTEETRKKISRILKEKHAKGEVKKRSKPDPTKIRKGFTHSEETRRKISQSLKKRWQNDEKFQEKMKQSFNSRENVSKRISDSLKKKWQDPDFRRQMMEKISQRKSGKDAMEYGKEHRKKISDAMKRKWQDERYREKALSSMKKSAEARRVPASPGKSRTATKKKKKKSSGMEKVTPMTVRDVSKRKKVKKRVTRRRSVSKTVIKDDAINDDGHGENSSITKVKAVTKPRNRLNKGVTSSPKASEKADVSNEVQVPAEKKKRKTKEKDGSVSRLREERRDLFDLLYGDEDDMNDGGGDDVGKLLSDSSSDKIDFLLGDEDLDSFDPYGLEDY